MTSTVYKRQGIRNLKNFLMFGVTKFSKKTWTILFTFLLGATTIVFYGVTSWNGKYGLLDARTFSKAQPCPTPASGDDQKRQLLLYTYGRTGSTFTSAIISHDPDVFYAAEPLHRMPEKYNIYQTPVSEETKRAALDIIQGFLKCDLMSVPGSVFQSVVFAASKSTKPFYDCITPPVGLSQVNLFLRNIKSPMYFVNCFTNMWKNCVSKKVTYVKTIRIHLNWTKVLLEQFPHLKVIFLVRDPRATLYSQAEKFETFTMDKDARYRAKFLCNSIKEDIGIFRNLSKLFPGRLIAFRYENGAMEPMLYAKKLYDFANLTFGPNTKEFIDGISHTVTPSTNPSYGYKKRDSEKAMNNWRTKATYDVVKVVDEECKFLYPQLGYKVIDSEKHLKSNESLFYEPTVEEYIFQMFQ